MMTTAEDADSLCGGENTSESRQSQRCFRSTFHTPVLAFCKITPRPRQQLVIFFLIEDNIQHSLPRFSFFNKLCIDKSVRLPAQTII